jgi:hypothetical protein
MQIKILPLLKTPSLQRMVGLKNTAQNERYVSGIFSKYVKISDK